MDELPITFPTLNLNAAVALAAVPAVVVVLQGAYRLVVERLGSVVRARVSVVQVPSSRTAQPVGSRR